MGMGVIIFKDDDAGVPQFFRPLRASLPSLRLARANILPLKIQKSCGKMSQNCVNSLNFSLRGC